MIPTSARRRIVIKTLIDYSTGWVAPGEELRRRLLLNLLPRPLLILQVQSDLALVHCPSINRNNPEGKQTNKQTSRGGMCRGTDAGGGAELCNMWSPIHNASEYVEELWRCIRDASEKHRVRYAGLYSDKYITSGTSLDSMNIILFLHITFFGTDMGLNPCKLPSNPIYEEVCL